MLKPATLARTVHLLLLAVAVALSVTAVKAQSHEVATVIELQGQVSVMRGGQEPLFQKGPECLRPSLCAVNAKEEIVTGPDGHAVFRISDGSTFEVFPNSRVTFQGQWTIEDMLQLIIGKIRVQIEHRNGPNPKKVSTPTAVISVRGTIFDVDVEDPDGTTMVSVEEGQVAVQHLLQPGPVKVVDQGNSITIYPNQPLAKASNQSPAIKFVFDRVIRAVADIVLNNPRVPIGGGGVPGSTGGPQADSGKNKKNPPPTAPPPPGGGL
jgi:FecR protein